MPLLSTKPHSNGKHKNFCHHFTFTCAIKLPLNSKYFSSSLTRCLYSGMAGMEAAIPISVGIYPSPPHFWAHSPGVIINGNISMNFIAFSLLKVTWPLRSSGTVWPLKQIRIWFNKKRNPFQMSILEMRHLWFSWHCDSSKSLILVNYFVIWSWLILPKKRYWIVECLLK